MKSLLTKLFGRRPPALITRRVSSQDAKDIVNEFVVKEGRYVASQSRPESLLQQAFDIVAERRLKG